MPWLFFLIRTVVTTPRVYIVTGVNQVTLETPWRVPQLTANHVHVRWPYRQTSMFVYECCYLIVVSLTCYLAIMPPWSLSVANEKLQKAHFTPYAFLFQNCSCSRIVKHFLICFVYNFYSVLLRSNAGGLFANYHTVVSCMERRHCVYCLWGLTFFFQDLVQRVFSTMTVFQHVTRAPKDTQVEIVSCKFWVSVVI